MAAAPTEPPVVQQWMQSLFSGFDKLKQLPRTLINEPVASTTNNSIAVAETVGPTARQELIAKIISTLIGLSFSFAVTYFGVKWLSNAMDPTRKEKKLAQKRAQQMLKQLGVGNIKLSEYELCIASNLVDPGSMTVTWDHIGGLEAIIQDIQETVIFPFKRRNLFEHSSLLQPPKGVLLYGPPGCGKTMLAKATAKAAGARFLNLQVSSLTDKWYGESQKRAEAVFSLALKLQPTIIFIDEIDSFLRSRNVNDHEATVMMKTQFMSFWDGLVTDNKCQVIIMGATNRPRDVDAAILRRMPCMFEIGMPEEKQRVQILKLILEQEQMEDVDYRHLGKVTENFTGSDLKEVCRMAAINRVHEYIVEAKQKYGQQFCEEDGGPLRNITMSDLTLAVNKVKVSKNVLTNSYQPPQLD